MDSLTVTDQAAVTKAVLDYYEGWFEGDAARMERALHPELCKRSFRPEEADAGVLTTMTAPQMIGWTAEGEGKALLHEIGDPRIEIETEDIYDTIANVTARSAPYREYVQLVRTANGWKVVNVLYQSAGAARARSDPARQTAGDEEAAIVQAVLDYFEGWFEGDAVRMERALHPELAKRSLGGDRRWWGEGEEGPLDYEGLDDTTADWMIDATARGVGKTRLTGDPRIQVDVVEVYDTIASVTVRSAIYREYLHLVRTRNGWKIANALWQRTLGSPS